MMSGCQSDHFVAFIYPWEILKFHCESGVYRTVSSLWCSYKPKPQLLYGPIGLSRDPRLLLLVQKIVTVNIMPAIHVCLFLCLPTPVFLTLCLLLSLTTPPPHHSVNPTSQSRLPPTQSLGLPKVSAVLTLYLRPLSRAVTVAHWRYGSNNGDYTLHIDSVMVKRSYSLSHCAAQTGSGSGSIC